MTPTRGTTSCYRSGCDHPECREAKRQEMARYRAARRTPRGLPAHGTRARYQRGCGCKRCKKAERIYQEERRKGAA